MSASAILYLFGMALVFVGERLLETLGTVRWLVDGAGGIFLIGAAVNRIWRLRRAEDPGIRKGHRTALALTAVGIGSLLLYVLSTPAMATFLGFEGEALARWTGSWGAFWPIVWLCGTLPLVVVDRAVGNSPVVAPPGRIRQALNHGLAAALGIALVFPVNYLADRHKKEWDLAYFKTAQAGSATRALVESLDQPIHVYAFYPPASRVGDEVEGYFRPLEGSKLTFRRLDQTAHPGLAEKLEVRENGRIAIANRRFGADGSDEKQKPKEADADPVVEQIRLSTDFEKAEKNLETLDRSIHKRLVMVSQGERVAYLTIGHGEFATNRDAEPLKRARRFRRILKGMGFRVEKTGLGQGLADGVPEDADLVAILGPTDSFLQAEVDALTQYLERGGSMFLALEPEYARHQKKVLDEGEPLRDLLAKVGVELGEGVLASRRSIYPMKHNKTDRMNLVTDRFSSHPATATLSEASARGARSTVLFTPTAGHLEIPEKGDTELKAIVRSPADSWLDDNGNLSFDKNAGETRDSRPIVAAATRNNTGENEPWRVLVSSDASMYSDLALGNGANQRFVFDGANWLLGTPSLGGRITDEEDVKIRHTKEGQAVWFYGTVVGVPLLILVAGALRVWRRGRGGDE